MREIISITAIGVAFVYFVAFGTAAFMALDSQIHWALAFVALAATILLRLWPLLPVFAFIGAHNVLGWPWWLALLLALPITLYIVSHYWTRATDFFRRPLKKQGA